LRRSEVEVRKIVGFLIRKIVGFLIRKIVGFLLCLVGHEHAQRHDELDPRIQERVAMQGL
jgi:hypothetical protein